MAFPNFVTLCPQTFQTAEAMPSSGGLVTIPVPLPLSAFLPVDEGGVAARCLPLAC